MSYIVTLTRVPKIRHLKARADDGKHGLLNCAFPKEFWSHGKRVSREDFSNEGLQIEVLNLPYDRSKNCYRVTDKDILRILQPSDINAKYNDSQILNRLRDYLNAHPYHLLDPSNTMSMDDVIEEIAYNELEIEDLSKVDSRYKRLIAQAIYEVFGVTRSDMENRKQDVENNNRNTFELELEEDYSDGMQMIHSAHFDTAADPYDPEPNPDKRRRVENVIKKEAFLILRIYEATILRLFDQDNLDMDAKAIRLVPGVPYTCPVTGKSSDEIYHFKPEDDNTPYGIRRKDLLKMAGLANYDGASESQSEFNHMKYAGLAYENPGNDPDADNVFFPGGNLEKFIYGKLELSDNAKEVRDVTTIDPVTGKRVKKMEMDPKSGKLKKVKEYIDYQFHDTSIIPEIGKLKNRNIFKDACAAKTTRPGQENGSFWRLPSLIPLDPSKPIAPQIKAKIAEINSQPAQQATVVNEPEVKPMHVEQSKEEPAALVTEKPATEEPITEVPVEETPAAETPVRKKIKTSWFKPYEGEKQNTDMAVAESLANNTRILKEAYCEQCGLDPNKKLTAKDYNDFNFNKVCVEHNAFYDVYKPRIFGDFDYE